MTDKNSEQIFEYFLEEFVREQPPPDLSDRIRAAWIAERKSQVPSSIETSAETTLVRPRPISPPPTPRGGRSKAAESMVASHREVHFDKDALPADGLPADTVSAELVPAEVVPVQKTSSAWTNDVGSIDRATQSTRRRHVVAALLAVVACGIVIVLARRLPKDRPTQANAELQKVERPNGSPSAPAVNGLANNKKVIAPETSTKRNDRASDHNAETLNIDNVPFDLNSAVANEFPVQPPAEKIERAEPMEDAAIVEAIDLRVRDLWRVLGVTPTKRLAAADRIKSVRTILTANASIESHPGADAKTEDLDVGSVIANSVNSAELANSWAAKFTDLWLARSSIPLQDQRVQLLQQSVAKHIRQGRPWNELVRALLGGELQLSEGSLAATFVSGLGGNGNRRLVERIGTNFLDTNLACVRCHDANLGQPNREMHQQQTYWSMLALLQGIDVQVGTDRSKRIAVDRQEALIEKQTPFIAYFDLLDGRLRAAEARLPDGEKWESMPDVAAPRAALANWISESELLEKATVNQVWELVFGRPLVPQRFGEETSKTEADALRLRRELRHILAEQFDAHQHDLRKLIGWIALSDAASREPISVNRSAWLNASQDDLRRFQRSDLAFATGAIGPASKSTAPMPSLENAVQTVLKWKSERLQNQVGQVALAQPGLVDPKRNKRSTPPAPAAFSDSILPAAVLSFATHGDIPTTDNVNYVQRLLDSKRLSWEQKVEHIFSLSPSNQATSKVKFLADELLKQHSGDRQTVLLDLLWAVQNLQLM